MVGDNALPFGGEWYMPEIPHDDLTRFNGDALAMLHSAMRGSNPWPLVLTGPTGVGKSAHALFALELCRVDRGAVAFRTAAAFGAELADVRRERHRWFEGDEAALWAYVRARDLFVLDDVGTREPSPTAIEAVCGVLDRRAGRPLILTTNLSAHDLERAYGSRVVDRMNAGTVVSMRGASQRGQNGDTK